MMLIILLLQNKYNLLQKIILSETMPRISNILYRNAFWNISIRKIVINSKIGMHHLQKMSAHAYCKLTL